MDSGPIPVAALHILADIHGYLGPEITHCAGGLRVLLQMPEWDRLDWSTVMAVQPPAEEEALPAAVPPTSSDRVTCIQKDVHVLAARFNDLQLIIHLQIAENVRASLAVVFPSSAFPPAPFPLPTHLNLPLHHPQPPLLPTSRTSHHPLALGPNVCFPSHLGIQPYCSRPGCAGVGVRVPPPVGLSRHCWRTLHCESPD